MTRYKNPQLQKLYDGMLALAEDKTSELYWKGEPRKGAGHRAAFWDGHSGKFDFRGPKRSAHVIPGTLSAVCFMAGREFARRKKRTARMSELHGPGPGEHAMCGLSFDAFDSGDHHEPVVFAKKGQTVTCEQCRAGLLYVRTHYSPSNPYRFKGDE